MTDAEFLATAADLERSHADRAAAWERQGFYILRSFADPDTCRAMLDRAVALARSDAEGSDISPAYVHPEPRQRDRDVPPEQRASKIFKLHRDERLFHEFCRDPRLARVLGDHLGVDLDCFLSQFIFKFEGSLGQPWHQDAFYFPFDRGPQIGVWLAVTEATLDNGPLWVLPGSHREHVHPVVPDPRDDAPAGYFEIVDHAMDGAVPVLMEPGDLLVFHGHLMHRSTDHVTGPLRAAMVYHYTEAGTVDGTREKWGFDSPNNDFMPVLREGELVRPNA